MSTYKKEFGTAVQNFAGDYTGAVEGQLWYNSTAGSFQFRSFSTAGAWATGGSLNTARWAAASAKLGTQTAALAFSGNTGPAPTTVTESYDGTSWTELNDINTSRNTSTGFGTATAAIVTGGFSTAVITNTESWNGTSWTEVNDLNQGRFQISGTGLSTAGLVFGGNLDPPSNVTGAKESWNGTCFSEVNDLNTVRYGAGAAGTQTAALAFGGKEPFPLPITAVTEQWNETCWSEVNDLNAVRTSTTGAGHTDTAAMSMGGNSPTAVALTELWNGTCWSEDTDLNTAREYLAGAGTTASALAFGGVLPPGTAITAATEEWIGAGAPVTETITTS